MYSKLSEGSKRSEKANENLFVELYPGLQRYCRYLSQSKWDGEDIAQETILKALKHYQSSKKINAALLNKIAYHQWIDTLRKRKREMMVEVPELSTVGDSTLLETVENLIQKFTPKQAVIFILKEAFSYKTNEIAKILGTSETAVKSSLHRAKKRLNQDDCFNVESFWSDEEQALLSALFYESLMAQDPSILLDSLPHLSSLASDAQTSKLAHCTISSIKSISPSNTFCMAA